MEEEDWLEFRKRELQAIKEIDAETILNDLGIPYRKRTGYYECRAIWRGDKNPSLSVFRDGTTWRWRDHGAGVGGTWIDLYMTAKNMTYLEAVEYLRETFLYTYEHKDEDEDDEHVMKEKEREKEDYEDEVEWQVAEVRVMHISENTEAYLAIYRKIKHIPRWLTEIEYDLTNIKDGREKTVRAFGVQDEAGNWHVRYPDPNYKIKERVIRLNPEIGSTYAWIDKGSREVCIVEGFIDGMRIDQLLPNVDIIILNGVYNWKAASDFIKEYYNRVYFSLDNDPAGIETEKKLLPYAKNPMKLCFKSKDIDEAVKNKEKILLKPIKPNDVRLDR